MAQLPALEQMDKMPQPILVVVVAVVDSTPVAALAVLVVMADQVYSF